MTTWNEFLVTRGAHIVDGRVTDFGDAQLELSSAVDATVLADLSQYALIGLRGEDAKDFLHGQITNDLRSLSESQAVFAGYLSAKGRMLANFLVMKRADDLFVLLPAALRESIQKRLSMFILRSRVQARDASDEWVRLGLSGPKAAESLVAALPIAIQNTPMAMGHTAQVFVVCLGASRFDVFAEPTIAANLWDKLAVLARPVGSPVWDWLLVNAGIPAVLPQTQDHFVPQMANMEILGGVSFNKGCYPGQEIVARSQYLGKVKRRLYLAHVDQPAQPGDELFAPEPSDQSCGLVANVAPAPGGGWDLLAVALTPSVEAGELHLKTRDGAALKILELPYSLA